jgi:PAS domain-containing protein
LERRLKESERWLTATLRSIGDAVIATDEDWRPRFMNPRAENLTGWDAKLAIGRALSNVLQVLLTTHPRPLDSSHAASGGGTAEGRWKGGNNRNWLLEPPNLRA